MPYANSNNTSFSPSISNQCSVPSLVYPAVKDQNQSWQILSFNPNDVNLSPCVTSSVNPVVEALDSFDIRVLTKSGLQLKKELFGDVFKVMFNKKEAIINRLSLKSASAKEKDMACHELMSLFDMEPHPNVVSLISYCLDPFCTVTKLMDAKSLSYLLHYCDDPDVEANITSGQVKTRLVQGIANGLLHLHKCSILHTNLRPSNILISHKYEARLTDFGLFYWKASNVYGAMTSSSDIMGWKKFDYVTGYMAPELLGPCGYPTVSSDVFSFGIVLNEIISEEEPFADENCSSLHTGEQDIHEPVWTPLNSIADFIQQGLRPKMSPNTPKPVRKLLNLCLLGAAVARPSMEDVVNAVKSIDIPDS